MGRRAKLKHLNSADTERFLKAATELHDSCCRPLLDVQSEHYRALSDLNHAICATIKKLGHELPWVNWASKMPPPSGTRD
jgi:hypothetical protein